MWLEKVKEHKYFSFINASLLILGTSVGVGMLGMPVELSKGGFTPGTFFLVFTWAISLLTGLIFVEAISYLHREVNFASLAEDFIGFGSKISLVFVYLLLFLSLLFAYVKGSGIFISDLIPQVPTWLGALIFLAIFLPLIIKGPKGIVKVNTLLTLFMFVAFVILMILGLNKINLSNLTHKDWMNGYQSSPLLVTSFGFHIIIPSLFIYLNKNKYLLRWAVILGTTITMIVYLLWNAYIMGVVPITGEVSLTTALQLDQTAISPLKKLSSSRFMTQLSQIFYFCALTTSFIGVSLSTIDFSIDAFKLEKTLRNKILVSVYVFVPALILSVTNLRIFYLSIKFGAALACVLLLIIFPLVLAIKISWNKTILRKTILGFAFIFSLGIIFAQCLSCF